MIGPFGRLMASLILVLSMALLVTGAASAAESGQTEAYLLLGGGGHYHVDGVDSGTRPAAHLGAGVSFGWISVEGSLSWTRLEWSEPAVCILWVGAGCEAISFEGDVVGLALQARRNFLAADREAGAEDSQGGSGGLPIVTRQQTENATDPPALVTLFPENPLNFSAQRENRTLASSIFPFK